MIAQPITATLRFDRGRSRAVAGWEAAMSEFRACHMTSSSRDTQRPGLPRFVARRTEDCTRMFARYGEWIICGSPAHPEVLGQSLAAVAAARVAPTALCDLLADDDLGTEVQIPVINRDREAAAELVTDDTTLLSSVTPARTSPASRIVYPTDVLARPCATSSASRLRMPSRATTRPARFFGIPDAARLVGAAADVNVIDLTRSRSGGP